MRFLPSSVRPSPARIAGLAVGVLLSTCSAACASATSGARADTGAGSSTESTASGAGVRTASGVATPPLPSPAADAFTAYARANGLQETAGGFGLAAPWSDPGVAAPPPVGVVTEGFGPGESLATELDPGGSHLVFRTPPVGGSCEPAPETEYRVTTSVDGSVVVTRLVPHVTVIEDHQPGTCGVGCGPVPAPPTSRLLLLPPTTRVRVVTVPWDVEHHVVTCDHPIPRP